MIRGEQSLQAAQRCARDIPPGLAIGKGKGLPVDRILANGQRHAGRHFYEPGGGRHGPRDKERQKAATCGKYLPEERKGEPMHAPSRGDWQPTGQDLRPTSLGTA